MLTSVNFPSPAKIGKFCAAPTLVVDERKHLLDFASLMEENHEDLKNWAFFNVRLFAWALSLN